MSHSAVVASKAQIPHQSVRLILLTQVYVRNLEANVNTISKGCHLRGEIAPSDWNQSNTGLTELIFVRPG